MINGSFEIYEYSDLEFYDYSGGSEMAHYHWSDFNSIVSSLEKEKAGYVLWLFTRVGNQLFGAVGCF
jgi:hypothetical protein